MKLLTDKTAGELVRHLKAAAPDPTRRARIAHGAIPSPPRPFACRIGRDMSDGAEDGALALYCYLPPETARAVRFRGQVVPPAIPIGTESNPWRPLKLPESGALYLILSFRAFKRADGEVDYQALSWTLGPATEPDPGACWPHLVATIDPSHRLVQYHLGSLLIGDPTDADAEQPPEIPPCGNPLNASGIGASDKHPMDDFGDLVAPPAGNTSQTGHPLDGEGDGGYTPMCAEDLNIDPLGD